MAESIHMKACLHSVKIDMDGEATIVFKIPLTNRQEALNVAEWTEMVLDILVKPETVKSNF